MENKDGLSKLEWCRQNNAKLIISDGISNKEKLAAKDKAEKIVSGELK